ncbi:MAG: glutamate-5-semialdehyde dehydrogenase [Planctomycetota bacterium]
MSAIEKINDLTRRASEASAAVAQASTESKNEVLRHMAALLEERSDDVVAANGRDMKRAREDGLAQNRVNRLEFGERKLYSRVGSLKKIADLPDPVGQTNDMEKRPNGMRVGRMRVPLGVILMIYEARPHVTVNAGAFALKSGNAIICKGGSEAENCNELLGELWAEALERAQLPAESIQVVSLSHKEVDVLLQKNDDVDLVMPRGGKKLIQTVNDKSQIPVIKHFEGICHVYIGRQADTAKALPIVLDSKTLMPSVCNAVETVLVDEEMAEWIPMLVSSLHNHEVEVRGDAVVRDKVPGLDAATEDDWSTEYLDTILSLRVVDGVDEAAEHIMTYGSGHTESIVTENYSDAQRFVERVDSSVVMVNASTMFCDGESLGMGAEIGISTDKIHARGPMGLEELTSYKHIILGEGHVLSEPNA